MRILSVLMLLFLLQNIEAQITSSVFNEKDSITITGIIKPYDSNKDDKMVSLAVYDIRDRQKQYSCLINTDGSFQCKLLQSFCGDLAVMYKAKRGVLYAEPGEKIGLVIHSDKFDSTNNLPAIFEVTGKSASVSNGINLYFKELFFDRLNELKPNPLEKNMSDEEFAKYKLSSYQKETNLLTQFLEKHHFEKNIILKNWVKNRLTYNTATEIISHPFRGKRNNTIIVPELKALLGNLPLYQDAALECSEYYRFLNSFAIDIIICTSYKPLYYASTQEYTSKMIPVTLDEVDKLSLNELTKQIVYHNIYEDASKNKRNIDNLVKYQNRFDQIIQDPFLKKGIDMIYNSLAKELPPVNIIEKLNAYKTTPPIKQKLTNLIETATKNKYAFIDFWGIWCGPCMGEMPFYAEFVENFRDKPVNFYFLSSQTSEADVAKTKEKFGIKANFINLTDDEVSVLNEIFEFTAYPSHFVLAPGGMSLGRYNHNMINKGDATSAAKNKSFDTRVLSDMIK